MSQTFTPTIKQLILHPWEELIGVYAGTEHDPASSFHTFNIIDSRIGINYLLAYLTESIEAKILQASLTNELIGKMVAVLCTDIPTKPIVVRVVDQKEHDYLKHIYC